MMECKKALDRGRRRHRRRRSTSCAPAVWPLPPRRPAVPPTRARVIRARRGRKKGAVVELNCETDFVGPDRQVQRLTPSTFAKAVIDATTLPTWQRRSRLPSTTARPSRTPSPRQSTSSARTCRSPASQRLEVEGTGALVLLHPHGWQDRRSGFLRPSSNEATASDEKFLAMRPATSPCRSPPTNPVAAIRRGIRPRRGPSSMR